ncbi:MAG: tail protein X [Aeromonadaceae bacterium]
MTTYTSLPGEMLDEITYRHYGTHTPMKMVLEANPGLAALGNVLPTGTVITLPPKPVEQKQTIKLWG